jgi:uncharacterized membrane protein YbhN (UPF0104 family)
VAAVLLAGGRVHAVADGLRRGLGLSPAWAAVGIILECVSVVGYMGLMSLVVGRATARVRTRESAQITLAGAAATRLLPTAGAGGAALTLWTLRHAGLSSRLAVRTLLVFLVVLYSVFLAAIVLSGAPLALGLVVNHGPAALSAIPALAAMLAIAIGLIAARHGVELDPHPDRDPSDTRRGSGLIGSLRLLGGAIGEARWLVRSGDPRLAGAIVYWMCDAAVLWATLHAFGSPPVIPVVALAYLVGQVANTVPIPGSVSGGIVGVLIAFGVPAGLAVPSVLAYRALAVWLPAPVALAAVPRLRATVARWAREDATAS